MKVSLPDDLIPLKFPDTKNRVITRVIPGYYWSKTDQVVYSCKSGTLRPLKQCKPWRGRNAGPWAREPHFVISISGSGYTIPITYIDRFLATEIDQFPIERVKSD